MFSLTGESKPTDNMPLLTELSPLIFLRAINMPLLTELAL